MLITPCAVELVLPQSPVPRSVGVHVSGIIRAMAIEFGILDRRWWDADDSKSISIMDFKQITDPASILRISMGLAWESWYIPQILEKYGCVDHPGEMHFEGIYLTHDAESLDVIITLGKEVPVLVIHEIKATYKSTKTVGDLTSQWMWLSQIKAYCKAAKTRHAKIHVLFICGDYKMPITPQLKVWDLEFEQKELDEHWDMLKEYKRHKEAQ